MLMLMFNGVNQK